MDNWRFSSRPIKSVVKITDRLITKDTEGWERGKTGEKCLIMWIVTCKTILVTQSKSKTIITRSRYMSEKASTDSLILNTSTKC